MDNKEFKFKLAEITKNIKNKKFREILVELIELKKYVSNDSQRNLLLSVFDTMLLAWDRWLYDKYYNTFFNIKLPKECPFYFEVENEETIDRCIDRCDDYELEKVCEKGGTCIHFQLFIEKELEKLAELIKKGETSITNIPPEPMDFIGVFNIKKNNGTLSIFLLKNYGNVILLKTTRCEKKEELREILLKTSENIFLNIYKNGFEIIEGRYGISGKDKEYAPTTINNFIDEYIPVILEYGINEANKRFAIKEFKILSEGEKNEIERMLKKVKEIGLKKALLEVEWMKNNYIQNNYSEASVVTSCISTQLGLLRMWAPEWFKNIYKEYLTKNPYCDECERYESFVRCEYFYEFIQKKLGELVQKIRENQADIFDNINLTGVYKVSKAADGIELELLDEWPSPDPEDVFICKSKREMIMYLTNIFELVENPCIIIEEYKNGFRINDFSNEDIKYKAFEKIKIKNIEEIENLFKDYVPIKPTKSVYYIEEERCRICGKKTTSHKDKNGYLCHSCKIAK